MRFNVCCIAVESQELFILWCVFLYPRGCVTTPLFGLAKLQQKVTRALGASG
jgi:hypothetical protein